MIFLLKNTKPVTICFNSSIHSVLDSRIRIGTHSLQIWAIYFIMSIPIFLFCSTDSSRYRVSNADTGSLLDLPFSRLRPQFGDQVQPTRREHRDAGRDWLFAHLRCRLHSCHSHRDPDKGFRQKRPAAILLQLKTVSERCIRRRRPHGLHRLL